MSKLKIVGNSEGLGTFTIISPNSDSNAAIELPHSSGTLVTNSQDLIPTQDEVYDLGSSSKAFKDLHISATTIFLGTQPISANSTGIVLPQVTIGSGNNAVKLKASDDGKLKQVSTDSAGVELPEVDIPQELIDLTDVIDTAPSQGQTLIWNNTTSKFEFSIVPEVFSDFTDVDTTTTPPTDTQVLTWSDANNEWSAGNNGFPLIVANTTELLALTGMLVGQEAFVTDLNRSYTYTGSTPNDKWRHAVSSWYATDDIMTNHPTTEISGLPSSISVNSGAAATEITLASVDPTDFPLVWSAEVTHPPDVLSAYPDGLITISNVDNVFTITPITISLDDTSGITGFVDIDVTWSVVDDCTNSEKISKELPVRFVFPNLNPSEITGAAESYNLTVGDIETITLTSTDPEGVPIIWSVATSPPFLGGTLITNVDNVFTIDASSQTGGGPVDYNGIITFYASDGVNTSQVQSTLVVDNLSPAPITGLPTTLDLSIIGTAQTITGSSYDPEGGPLTWSFTTSGNLGNTNISHDGNGSFTFSGTSHDAEHEFNLIVTVEDVSSPVRGGNSQTHSILCTYEYPNVEGSQIYSGAVTTGYNSSRGTMSYWTCPPNVYFVHALCVGGGGHGSTKGGGGGGLGWKNNIPVVPGQSYAVFAGRGGENTDSMPSQYSGHTYYRASANGENKSYFISTSVVAGFAGRAAHWFTTSGTVGSTIAQNGGGYVGDGGGNGGRGIGGGGVGGPTVETADSSGGGAGGYTGNGGGASGGPTGSFVQPYEYAPSGSGGGGGGGAFGADKGGAGGGVGLYGIGANGQGGQKGPHHDWAQTSGNPPFWTSTMGGATPPFSWYGSASPGGKGGSGGGNGGGPGMHGTNAHGGYYGGGATANWSTRAGPGAVRLIWGKNKSWPTG